MELLAGSFPLFLAFFHHVQCHIVNTDVTFTPSDLRSLKDSHNEVHSRELHSSIPVPSLAHIGSFSKVPSRNKRRDRRQTTGEGRFSWNHRFTIEENQPSSLTKETAYIWQDNTKRLKHMLEKDTVFQFLTPTGLRISIPANNINMRIVDYRIKLNDEFRNNDAGHFGVNSYKRNGISVYEVPQLRLKQGDTLYYWMRLALGKEAFDVVVKGLLEIAKGNPHQTTSYAEDIPFRPTAAVVNPQPQYSGSPSPSLGGGSREAFVWNHQFTINATYTNEFTKESASRWLQHAEFIKRFLQKHIDFKFLNPSGLVISIPDDSISILDFRIKLNDEFRENDSGHFAPSTYKRDNMWTYYIPQLRVQRGDRVYYWMRVKRIKDGFDAIVRGLLEINQGNPHTESSFISTTSAPYQYPQVPQTISSYQPTGGQQPIGTVQQSIGSGQQPIGTVQQSIGSGQQPIGGFQPAIGVNQPVGNVKPSVGNGQQPVASFQPTIVGNQPIGEHTGNGQAPIGSVEPELLDRFGQPDNNGPQAFNWEHKFTSINLNKTSEAGDATTWASKADEYLKKALERNVKFQFLNPIGLRVLISGENNNIRILAFNLKLNEEFQNFDAGHYLANVMRTSDGSWSYYYPNLKLKEGDKAHYWMKVTFGKEMWLYIVKGLLEISLGDPHNNLLSIRTTSPAPTAPATYIVKNITANHSVKWEHRFSVNKTNNDGSITPEEGQLLKNMFENNIDFKMRNPSGLNIFFSGEGKEFRVLAFNIKLNEEFGALGPGHYVANVTKTDGQLTYYYPNLKVKLGDRVYYWLRVMLGKDMTDFVLKGELKLIQGDPHFGAQVPEVPPPIVWTQPLPSTTSSNQPPSSQNIQASQPQNPVPSNNQFANTNSPPPLNEPLNPLLPNQAQRPEPLPLSLGQPPFPTPDSATPARGCVYPQSGPSLGGIPPCQEGLVNYR